MSEQIPNGWKFMPIHSLGTRTTTPNTGLVERNLLSLSYGEIVRKDIETGEGLLPESFETYQIVEAGDTILRFTDLQNDQRSLRSGLVPERGIITSAYLCFHPDILKLDHRFFAYTMRSLDQRKVFYEMGSGVRQNLNWGEFAALLIPVPPLETQRRIADYLDKETAEIDAMVHALDEYSARLSQRISLLLVDMTGLRSRGQKAKLGWFANVTLGKTLQSEQNDPTEIQVPYVRAANIQPNGVFSEEVKTMWALQCEAETYNLQRGDVLVVEGGAGFGRSLTLKADLRGWIFQNHVMRIRPIADIPGEFIDYTIRAYLSSGFLERLAVGATIPGISSEKVRSLEVAHYGPAEWRARAQHIRKELEEIEKLQTRSAELRSLLLKRRQVLINDVVTGKKQV